MSQPTLKGRHNGRTIPKQIDNGPPLQPPKGPANVMPLQPLTPAEEPNPNEFELRIAWLVRLIARGHVANLLAGSLDRLAKSLAVCMVILSLAAAWNLISTKRDGWTISVSKYLPFSFQKSEN